MKNLYTHFTLFSLLLISTLSFAQSQRASIQVNVTDFKHVNLKGEQILFVNQDSKKTIKGISNAKGNFTVKLPAGYYFIKMKSIGDATDYSTIEIPPISEGQTYSEMAIKIQISVPRNFTLNKIHFASNKAVLLTSSYHQLKDLVAYLNLKPNLKIEIQGHTDSDGSEEDNMKLSIERANAIKHYLISKGIHENRLKTIGYGEKRPITENSTPAGKQKNRRTEIRIL